MRLRTLIWYKNLLKSHKWTNTLILNDKDTGIDDNIYSNVYSSINLQIYIQLDYVIQNCKKYAFGHICKVRIDQRSHKCNLI